MKCFACQYEYREPEMKEVHEYYKSGEKKGQIKSTSIMWKSPDEGHPQFLTIGIEKDFEFVKYNHDLPDYYCNPTIPVKVFACPKCGTLKIEV